MFGVVAAVFGLLLAFVIVIAYQTLEADENVSREAAALSLNRAGQRRVPGARWQRRASRSRYLFALGGRARMATDARQVKDLGAAHSPTDPG